MVSRYQIPIQASGGYKVLFRKPLSPHNIDWFKIGIIAHIPVTMNKPLQKRAEMSYYNAEALPSVQI